MAYNPYIEKQPVYITDPSGRLKESGISTFYFPYTPTLTSLSNSNYSNAAPTHSNFQQSFFESGQNISLTIAAPILVENQEQGRHILKALDFFRGSMKMRFGKQDPQRGLPPPVLRLFAHGIYTNVPVLLTDFTFNLDSDISYIDIDPPTGDGPSDGSGSGVYGQNLSTRNETQMGTRVPVSTTFVMSLVTSYSPRNIRENFTLDKYLRGEMKGQGYV